MPPTHALVAALLAEACTPEDPEPLAPNAFAFGLFGDGPYRLVRAAWNR